jgi:ribosomal protein S18 acetylase RimI-like enzyme
MNPIQIIQARVDHVDHIIQIGKESVFDAHRESCSKEILDAFIESNYNPMAIRAEIEDPKNCYQIICFNGEPVGFSKSVFNANHDAIQSNHVTKLDRIYLLNKFQGVKLGYELMRFNIDYSKQLGQSGMWLYTWIGNKKAINFYSKMGFEIIGSHDFHISGGHTNPNHHMYLHFD